MKKTLTRSELYELVWAHPRSTLAKELGISDVAIGKHCARSHIPAPPPGYWARKAVGKAGRRPPLPIRLPGHPREITFGDRGYGYQPRHEDLSEPIVPPKFGEQMEIQVEAAVKIVGRVTSSRDLSSPHKALKRVLDAEVRRRQKVQEQGWTYDKPRFDSPQHQRQLRLFNDIARAITPVTTAQEVLSQDEWIQGTGTLHFLKLRLQFGERWLELSIIEPGIPSNRTRAPTSRRVDETTLRTGSESSSLGFLEWNDRPGKKLESQLTTIVQDLLGRAELAMRRSAQFVYEQRVERRSEIAQQREAAERAREAQRLEEIAAHRKRVRQHIIDLGEQHRAALDIRGMVSALSTHPDIVSGRSTQFDEWARMALSIADELDPMRRSLSVVINDVGAGPVP